MTIRDTLRTLCQRDSRPILLALVLLIVAVVIPPVKLPRRTFDHIIVFDISQSMGVEDYDIDGAPVSRLEFARAAVRDALRTLPCGSRIGWGVFAEYRTLLLLAPIEVCENYGDLVASLENIDGRMRWANASEIAKGVYWSLRAAKEAGGTSSILFFTDGHEAPPIDPDYPPRRFDDVIPGETHGWIIGTGGDVPRRIPKIDDEGRLVGYWRAWEVMQPRNPSKSDSAGGTPREHLSSLREAHLREVAQDVGLQYTRMTDASSVAAAMRDARLARREWVRTDVRWIPAAGALLLLLYRFMPVHLLTRFRRALPSAPSGEGERSAAAIRPVPGLWISPRNPAK